MSSDSLRRLKWGDVAPIPETVEENPTVETTVTQLLRANSNRVQVYAYNPGANPVHLRWDADPTTSVGYPLEANGGQKGFTFEEDGERIWGELRAIATTANVDIFIAADEMPGGRPRRVA